MRDKGLATVVTARDYGDTFELLRERGEPFHAIGAAYGASKLLKIRGLVGRTRALVSFLRRERPDVLVCASRAGVLAARLRGIRSFVIADYELVETTTFRLSRSTVLFPDVIDPREFTSAGIPSERLVPFRGLKEDLTFAGIDVAQIRPAMLDGDPSSDLVRVLFRPPAEESHYFDRASRTAAVDALGFLSRQPGVLVVFSPRYPWQVEDLRALEWVREPLVLAKPVPFVELLKAVDLVLCSGGTMLREAAYLGIPAYSIFRGGIGAVDRYLASIGRVTILGPGDRFDVVRLEKRPDLSPLNLNRSLAGELADLITQPRSPSV
jgi:predicted glycosyltransferase